MSLFENFLSPASRGGGGVGAFGQYAQTQSALAAGGEQKMRELVAMSMTPRQKRLNGFWAWYKALNYDVLHWDWDGNKANPDAADLASIAAGGAGSAGYGAGGSVPNRFRQPLAPYRLPRVVVDRFTGLLFGEGHHPSFTNDPNPEVAELANALAEQTRLWSRFDMARTYGGAQGTSVVSFKFLDGSPRIEVHDPRWCFPTFSDREAMRLSKLEVRYAYPVDEWDATALSFQQVWYWYRRVIDEVSDTVFKPIRLSAVTDLGALLNSDTGWTPGPTAVHKYGFCPAIWIQNTECTEDIDGDPDFWGAFQAQRQYDELRSQGTRAAKNNCDPTVVLKSATVPGNLKRGSANGNALHLSGETDEAKYLEMTGAGVEAAAKEAAALRSEMLEMVQCVLDHSDGAAAQTATEINRRYASMLGRASRLREQYGQRGCLPLMTMILRSVALHTGRGEKVILPARMVDADSNAATPRTAKEWAVPPDSEVGTGMGLKWGPFFAPTPMDAKAAVETAGLAVTSKLVPRSVAVEYIAPFMGIEDPKACLEQLLKELADEQARMDQSAMLAASLSAAAKAGTVPEPGDLFAANKSGEPDDGEVPE